MRDFGLDGFGAGRRDWPMEVRAADLLRAWYGQGGPLLSREARDSQGTTAMICDTCSVHSCVVAGGHSSLWYMCGQGPMLVCVGPTRTLFSLATQGEVHARGSQATQRKVRSFDMRDCLGAAVLLKAGQGGQCPLRPVGAPPQAAVLSQQQRSVGPHSTMSTGSKS